MKRSFDSLYSHGFVRVAVCVPNVRVADPAFNLEQTLDLVRQASEIGSAVALFPELGLSAYTGDDLFHQDVLLESSLAALGELIAKSKGLSPVILAGLPIRLENKLFNCAAVVYRGLLLGLVPKSYLPNYREFYEQRQFRSGRDAIAKEATVHGVTVPFGTDLIFQAKGIEHLTIGVEICEDLWTPLPPSTFTAMAGATVLANLSASNITIGKADHRRSLCATQSSRCAAAYLFCAAGRGESTTDLAWDGQALIYENNVLLAEAERFGMEPQLISADIDLERLVQERMRLTSFNDCVHENIDRLRQIRKVEFEFDVPQDVSLRRNVERFPFVPSDAGERDERCYEAYNIQVHGLAQRLSATGFRQVVIGVSGGLDSTHALIVAARTMDRLQLDRGNILAYTMPGFATSDTTLRNARALMQALGVTAGEIDIRPSCLQMLKDIEHPYANNEPVHDVTFENVQAGERTSHLFRLANLNHALVLGTGDLSELALGWSTYGVGDHMSHYNVNSSVPKTLIQYLIRWIVETKQFDKATSATLSSIVATEISPELVPHSGPNKDLPAQSTQERIGPYELQDFNLYYITRFGLRPSKVAFLCYQAWRDKSLGKWPGSVSEESRNDYDLAQIKKWLKVFLYRFFQISQFKRSCVPNGPKVASGSSLSPRGDWRAPSDAESRAWIEELEANVPD